MRPMQKVETFPDGVAAVYSASGRKIEALKGTLRFEEQSVGVNRYYQSATSIAGNRIDRVIKVPKNPIASREDIVVLITEGSAQYRILRIQEKPERGVDLWELQSVQVSIPKGE